MSDNELDREDYKRIAQLSAELASLAIKEDDFGKAEKFLKDTQKAIDDMRKQP